jgi:putative heme-binding domain-containing protein
MRFILLACCLILPFSETLVAQDAENLTLAEDVEKGRQLFTSYCARCHGIYGGGGTGPNLRRSVLRRAPDDNALFDVIQSGIPASGMPGTWILSDREIEQVIAFVRSLGQQPLDPLPGDAELGRLVFEQNGCAGCHIVQGIGESLGPDLTEVGARRGAEHLRTAVQHPGTAKPLDAEGFTIYLMVRVITQDGREVRGMRVNEDSFSIQLRDEQNVLHSFDKLMLKELIREEETSFMPGVGSQLSPKELDNLIAYLASLRG